MLICYRLLGQLSRYRDSLRVGQSGDRIPLRVTFSTPVQIVPETNPPCCEKSNWSFPVVKPSRRDVDHLSTSDAEVKEGVVFTSYLTHLIQLHECT